MEIGLLKIFAEINKAVITEVLALKLRSEGQEDKTGKKQRNWCLFDLSKDFELYFKSHGKSLKRFPERRDINRLQFLKIILMTVKNGFHGVQNYAGKPARRHMSGAKQDDENKGIKLVLFKL